MKNKIFVFETYGYGYGSEFAIAIAPNEEKARELLAKANYQDHGLVKAIEIEQGVTFIGGYVE